MKYLKLGILHAPSFTTNVKENRYWHLGAAFECYAALFIIKNKKQ
jgi:hypothetical protein